MLLIIDCSRQNEGNFAFKTCKKVQALIQLLLMYFHRFTWKGQNRRSSAPLFPAANSLSRSGYPAHQAVNDYLPKRPISIFGNIRSIMTIASFRLELHPLLFILFVLVFFVVKLDSLLMFSVTLGTLLLIKKSGSKEWNELQEFLRK